MADAAAIRDQRRRLVLADRLAQVEVLAEAVAKGSLELVSNAFPAMLEALEATIKAPNTDAEVGEEAGVDGGLLEALIRAHPQRARRVLDTLARTTGGT